ncbi:MAG: hypothetical protein JWR16_1728, partial [Nevskia sp.]|nr:hypothetical protein [Nevskia sp.]
QVKDSHRILRDQSDEVRSNVDLNLKAIRDETNSVVSTVEAPSTVNTAPVAPPPASPPTTPAPAPTAAAVSENTAPAPPQNHYGP